MWLRLEFVVTAAPGAVTSVALAGRLITSWATSGSWMLTCALFFVPSGRVQWTVC